MLDKILHFQTDRQTDMIPHIEEGEVSSVVLEVRGNYDKQVENDLSHTGIESARIEFTNPHLHPLPRSFNDYKGWNNLED